MGGAAPLAPLMLGPAAVGAPSELAAVVDSLDQGLCLVDTDRRITFVNATGRRLLGITTEAVVGRSLQDLALPGEPLAIVARWLLVGLRERVQHGHRHSETEVVVPTLSGANVPMDVSIAPITRHGRGAGAVVTFVDVSQRQLTQRALWEGEERFKAIFHAAAIGMMRLDITGRIEESNEALQHLLGRCPAELRSTPFHEWLDGQQIGQSRRLFQALIAGELDRYELEAQFRSRDGAPVWGHLTMAALRDRTGWPRFAIGTVQDLTERKRLERELGNAQRLESIGRMAAGVAHEINTPIQFIGDNVRFLSTAVELLNSAAQAAAPAPDQAAELEFLSQEVPLAIEQTIEGIQRVSSIVKAMKALSHQPQRDHTRGDINKAITDALMFGRNEIKYVADVVVDLDDLPPVVCSLSDLGRVFLNLLVNAAHAIADVVEGDGRGSIHVRSRLEDDQAVVEITDSGAGIPEEIRERVFDPFFTTKEVGRGTGQGLALARAIVAEQHGGQLSFESTTGAGTRFVVRLPVHGTRERADDAHPVR